MLKLLKLLLIICCYLEAFAFGAIPVSSETYSVIQEKFLDSNGELSEHKLNNFKHGLKKLQNEVRVNIENFLLNQERATNKEKERFIIQNDYVDDMEVFITEWIDDALNIKNETDLIKYLSKLVDIEHAIKVDNVSNYSESKVLKAIHNFMHNYRLSHKVTSVYGEANNLINPDNQMYFTQAELEVLKKNGEDISKFNPPSDNGVIELLNNISEINPLDRINGNNLLHSGLKMIFPENNEGYFKQLIKKGEHGEVVFYTKDSDGNTQQEFKLKVGHEIHSKPTAEALGMTLGLFQNHSRYVKNFKIYIGEMKWEDILLELTQQFSYEYIERIVLKHGSDDKGNYVIVKEGVIETIFNSKKLNPVGAFYPNFKKGLREIRALMLFNMWIGNADLRANENNQVLIRKKEDSKQLYYIQKDVGFAFGYYSGEKPTEFPWSLVKGKVKGETIFNFRSFVPNNDWKQVTYADAKWMVRKIAQLTREQITTCVKLGNWPSEAPYNYEQLIIEKLINRRNQLVKTFDLAGEKLPNGKIINFMKVDRDVAKDAKPTKEYLTDYTVDFRSSIKYNYVKPALRTLRGTLVDGLAGISQRIDKISIPDTWFGLDHGGVIAQVLVGTTKQIMKNPEPSGPEDRFIVREGFKMGTRFGYGAIFSGLAAYIKEYILVYPVSDLSKIDEKGKFIVDVTMPYRIMQNFLPPKHILITESYIEGAARTRIQTPLTGGGNETSISRINLSRTVISKKETGLVKVYEDTSKYGEVTSKLFLKLGMFRLDQYMASFGSGKLERDVYVLRLDDESTEAIDQAVMNNNPGEIKKHAIKVQEIDSRFIENASHLNIFGFFQQERRSRTDDFEILTFNEDGNVERLEHQLEGTYIKRRAWKIITNGEERIARVTMSSKVDINDELVDPYLALSFEHIDLNTTAQEIDKAYIPFFNGIANDPKFIQFSASEHSLSGKYGHLILQLREKIYKEGIEKLLNLSEEEYWKNITEVLKIKDIKKNAQKMISYQGRRYNLNRVKRKAQTVWNLIKDAQQKKSFRVRIKSLMKAIVESIPKKQQSQNPIILSALNRFIGPENFYLTAEIESPDTFENYMPGGITPYNFLGKQRHQADRDLIKIQLGDALKIYNLF